MKNTKDKILKLLSNKELSASEIARKLSISRQMAHKHLGELVKQEKINKKGKPPKVFYYLISTQSRIRESAQVFEKLLTQKRLLSIKESNLWSTKNLSKNNFDLHFLFNSAALFSSKIEGNSLDLNSFFNPEAAKKFAKKEIKEIIDLQTAYKFAKEHNLNEKNFLHAHNIFSHTLLPAALRGKYRKDKIGVFSKEGLAYLAIEPELVAAEMSILFSFIDELLSRRMQPQEIVAWGMYLHVVIAFIHPFADGNGRAARLIQKWFLAQKLSSKYWYLQTEKFYYENLQDYYESLACGVNYWEIDFSRMQKFLDLHNLFR